MDKKRKMLQAWNFGGTEWVIGDNNFNSNSNYAHLNREQLLAMDAITSMSVEDYLLSKDTDERKHNHYYKDVRHLDYIDIYRFCDLFIEDDPSGALHHAIKKLAACGRRGAGKDELKDLKEAADTINRKIEMLEEDKLKSK